MVREDVMKREATYVVVNVTVKHIDDNGKLIGVRESETAKIPVNQFESGMCSMVYEYHKRNNHTLGTVPRTSRDYRKSFVKLFQRWIVDNFLYAE